MSTIEWPNMSPQLHLSFEIQHLVDFALCRKCCQQMSLIFKAVARTSDTFGTKKNFFVPADFSELRKSWIKKLIPRYTFKVFLCRKKIDGGAGVTPISYSEISHQKARQFPASCPPVPASCPPVPASCPPVALAEKWQIYAKKQEVGISIFFGKSPCAS